MSHPVESPGARIRTYWERLSPLPGGRRLFSLIIGQMVPYTGSMGSIVETLETGYAKVRLPDRRRVRNHLRSVHAIALANLGEFATGLALVGALGPEVRAILTGLEMRYVKKARGVLTAEARCTIPHVTASVDYRVEAEIRDVQGDLVAVATALWRLSPVPMVGGRS